MNVPERIEKLRKIMAQRKFDVYLVPTADYHQTEYVGEYFKARQYITGFTGSSGIAVITQDEAGLWTDGRYFIQAEKQLAGSGVKLFKMGEQGVPEINDFLSLKTPANGTLAVDGRTLAMKEGLEIEEVLSLKNANIEYRFDLINEVWHDRPELAKEPVFILSDSQTGESRCSKLVHLREFMSQQQTDTHLLATLDDICWLLNIRGRDILYTPTTLCYAIVELGTVILFIDEAKLSAEVKKELNNDGIQIKPYNDVYAAVKAFDSSKRILIDPDRVNYALYKDISSNVQKVEIDNPTVEWKAMKNDVELENIRKAHIKDGIAVTKFMYWLKKNISKMEITEISASNKLEQFRAEQDGFISPSFDPICAYKDHAAMVHYSSTKETDVQLKPEHLFLVDTGGHYLEGSTDITRTFALGEISDDIKLHYTTVLRSMMALSNAKFMYGCRGYNLDILARAPMWDMNLNYNHGTGHGVGYLLNIHEGPSGFRWYIVPSKHETHVLEQGMVLSNEPGIYIENSHGIRIENELVIRKGEKNAYGQFMYMETITFAPIDLDAIDPNYLSLSEKNQLNNYHKQVYNLISPSLSENEREWLKIYTREI